MCKVLRQPLLGARVSVSAMASPRSTIHGSKFNGDSRQSGSSRTGGTSPTGAKWNVDQIKVLTAHVSSGCQGSRASALSHGHFRTKERLVTTTESCGAAVSTMRPNAPAAVDDSDWDSTRCVPLHLGGNPARGLVAGMASCAPGRYEAVPAIKSAAHGRTKCKAAPRSTSTRRRSSAPRRPRFSRCIRTRKIRT